MNEEVLRGHLLAAWNLLRVSGAPAPLEARWHLLALILLRRLSDHYEEHAERMLCAGATASQAWEDPDAHAFYVPPAARSAVLRERAASPDLGTRLNQAAAALCLTHPALRGVFVGLDFRDVRALGEEPLREATLRALVRHLAVLPLRDSTFADRQVLPAACAVLLARIAADCGGGDSPECLRGLLRDLLAPRAGMRLCDPCCGLGGTLLACARRVAGDSGRQLGLGEAPLDLVVHGQEVDARTAALCQANLLLSGLSDARIERGDALRAPRLLRDGALLRYDRVVAVPPPRLPGLSEAAASRDPLARFVLGTARGPWAVALHALAVLAPGGVAAVVLPLSCLYRQGREEALRAALLAWDVIDAVIALPSPLGPAAVLLLRRDRPAARQGRVLLAQVAGSSGGGLCPRSAARVTAAYHRFTEDGALVLPAAELSESNLSPLRYLPAREAPAAAPPASLPVLLAEVARLEAERDAVVQRLDRRVADLFNAAAREVAS